MEKRFVTASCYVGQATKFGYDLTKAALKEKGEKDADGNPRSDGTYVKRGREFEGFLVVGVDTINGAKVTAEQAAVWKKGRSQNCQFSLRKLIAEKFGTPIPGKAKATGKSADVLAL